MPRVVSPFVPVVIGVVVLGADAGVEAPLAALAVLAVTVVEMVRGRRAWGHESHVWAPLAGGVAMVAVSWTGATEGGDWSITAAEIGRQWTGYLPVVVLILSFAYLSGSLDRAGFFRWCAARIVRAGHGRLDRLLAHVFFGVSLLSLFVSNDVVIMSMTPILIHLGRVLGLRDMTPILITEFVAANTASMGLYTGNPTNILIADAAGRDFVAYARGMLVPAGVATGLAFGALRLRFARGPATFRYRVPPGASPPWTPSITLRVAAMVGLLGWATAVGSLGRGGDWVAAGAAVLAGAVWWADGRGGAKAGTVRLPLEIVPFVAGFGLVVHGLDRSGVLVAVADVAVAGFRDGLWTGCLATGVAGVVMVNLVNNLPGALAFTKMWGGSGEVGRRLAQIGPEHAEAFVDVAAFVANFGANLSVVGAVAGLLWLRMVRSMTLGSELRVPTAGEFFRHGCFIVAVVTPPMCLVIPALRWLGWSG